MGAWEGKFVIGLTGNIATGKSVVRQILESLGVYGIDADLRVHQILTPTAPGYEPVIGLFGRWILKEDGTIDRARLGRLVFCEPEALKLLEQILHPLVESSIDLEINQIPDKVIVIEAIKLFETGWDTRCDTVWVTYASQEVQARRLMEARNMSREDAMRRIMSQGSQDEKLEHADVVIYNEGTLDAVRKQVLDAWEEVVSQHGLRVGQDGRVLPHVRKKDKGSRLEP